VTDFVPTVPDRAAEWAFLLDIDGTLLDIAPTPSEVFVPNCLHDTLLRLDHLTGNALALVSGRPLEDIDRIFAPLRLAAVGGHGAEMRVSATAATIQATLPLAPELREQIEAIAALDSAIRFEDKGYSVALHYRLAPDLKDAVEHGVAAVCAKVPDGVVEVLRGKAVVEVKRIGFEKGTAVRELMRHPPFAGRRPVFIGDDTTDETVFAVLPEWNGVGFSVGRKFVGATGCFATPHDVRTWLSKISKQDTHRNS
jgi:trehalose 6-phosphate phosphatase